MRTLYLLRRGSARLTAVFVLLAALVVPAVRPPAAGAATLPPGFQLDTVANVFAPTGLTFTPDGRMLVINQLGLVHVYQNGEMLASPALDLGGRICSDIERGLSGITVDPAFATNRFVYLYYTAKRTGCSTTDPMAAVNRVARFTLSDANVIDPGSEVVLLDNIPSLGHHISGDMHFGADGLLYVASGDGGCKLSDPRRCGWDNDNARSMSTLLGKILRIRSDGSVPADNPYAGVSGARRCGNPAGVPAGTGPCSETFASGLRNPFRIAFKPGTNTFHINDTGNDYFEEVDLGAKGADYGWNIREGHCAVNTRSDCGPPPAGLTQPIHDYDHNTGCTAITGGAFVPEGYWPDPYSGSYLYADWVCGTIFRLVPQGGGFTREVFAFGPHNGSQALYFTAYTAGGSQGEIRRITFGDADSLSPVARLSATPTSGTKPLDVRFDGAGSVDPDGDPLTYHWDFGDGSAPVDTTVPAVSHRYQTDGERRATLRVTDDRQTSSPAAVVITVGRGPSAAITAPGPDDRFAVGQTVKVSGRGTDPDDGTLPDGSLSWQVVQHHNEHAHPFLGPVTGGSVTLQYPHPEDLAAAATSYLEVFLTVTDSSGLRSTTSMKLLPRTVKLTFTTNRSTALTLQVADQSLTGTRSITSWVGYPLTIKAPSPQAFPGRYYTFKSWSDGKPASHVIVTPSAATTYTANFTRVDGSPPAPPPPPGPPPTAAIARTPTGGGYWLVRTDGKVSPFGDARLLGDAGTQALSFPVVGMAATPSGAGYWLVAADGSVLAFGDAAFKGSMAGRPLNRPIVGMAPTPSGGGYWLVALDGGMFAFGDAGFFGSTGGRVLNKPVVGMGSTPSGRGYWLVASDGGMFAFGDAPFRGSMGGQPLNQPIVGMAATPSGNGYWLVASDGGMFAFPDAPFLGSTGSMPPSAPGVGMAATPDGGGYWLAAADGRVFNFGNAGALAAP
jgi:glucose/arabinose dehydrogenase/PKD repeat protein